MRLLGSLHCKGPQIMSSISDELGVTRRNVTALVDALEEEGLVRRKPHPTDRRATVIEMTDRGELTMDRVYDEHRIAVASCSRTWTRKTAGNSPGCSVSCARRSGERASAG